MPDEPQLFGAEYSVYVRIVRLCLLEKGISYSLTPVDVFADGGPPPGYLTRHPFGRIPAFEHQTLRLYETSAIARYIDEAFEGPRLQPSTAAARARCNQLISIADNYAYPSLVWGIYVERVSKPARGLPADEEKVAWAKSRSRTCLAAMSELMGSELWLAGETLTLADLYAAAMFDYFIRAPEGAELVGQHRNLSTWWLHMAERPSMNVTRPA